MKKIFALSAASVLMAAPAIAGPYANVEANSGFSAGDYDSTLLEVHTGYAGDLGEDASYYIQAGPAFDFGDDADAEAKVSGKIGASVALSERVDAYGEISVLSAEDWDLSEASVGVKTGFTYTF